jgi:hypothetical protein
MIAAQLIDILIVQLHHLLGGFIICVLRRLQLSVRLCA